jgi:protein ImuB
MKLASRRIVALWFPRLATDRFKRRCASPEAPPLVVVEKAQNALRLAALDRKASALGLSIGQPLANARAMLPALKVMAANAPADLKLLERIADWCERFTPFVALQPPRSLLLDVTGAAHLFGGEEALLGEIREKLRKQGFIVRGALAASALAAHALARYRDGAIAPPGKDGEIIAPLPVEALNCAPEIAHALRHAGLKTIAQVAARKRAELAARFGAEFVFTLDAAFGKAEKPISPRNPLPDYRAERNFAEPVVCEEIIRATLKSLAGVLSEVLEKSGEGARRLDAAFFRADGAVSRIAIETGAPTRDSAMIERLFREKLAALADPLDPGFGFDLIRLSASRTQKCEADAAGLDADANAQKEIRFLVDRLAARFGPHRILAFQPQDTHIPEAAWAAVPAQYAESAKIAWTKIRRAQESPRRPLRFFARPEPAGMLQSGLRWRSVERALTAREGPERIAMEWWRHQTPQPARDYYRVEDNEGRRYWLYRGVSDFPQWFVQGLFA